MEKECYVSRYLAHKLKQKGFDWKCRAVWHFDGDEWVFSPDYGATFSHPIEIPHWNDSRTWGQHVYSTPTLEQTQKWLREIHKIHVPIEVYQESGLWSYNVVKTEEDNNFTERCCLAGFFTYEEALEAGLDTALDLI